MTTTMRRMLTVAALVLSSVGISARAGNPMVVGYYMDWTRTSYAATDIPYGQLTHIAHAFLLPAGDGSLTNTRGFAYPELVQAAHGQGVKVVVSVGGWGLDAQFTQLAADSGARARLATSLASFCTGNGYDGVDVDWEYPNTATDSTNMRLLVHQIRLALDAAKPGMLLAITAPAGYYGGRWFNTPGMEKDLDWIGVMTYDYYGNWSSKAGPNAPLYGNWSQNSQGWVDDAISYFASTRGFPRSKLLMGTPFYGWVFNASAMYGASTGASQAPYSSIAPNLTKGWTRSWDALGQVPYMINAGATQVISYDDSASVAAKCAYVKSSGISGTIIWALGQDRINGVQPLLAVIGANLFPASSVIGHDDAVAVPVAARLEQNWPNPFNPATSIAYTVHGSEFMVHGAEVKLTVYDLLGREVATLVNEKQIPGRYTVRFDATGLASGVYIARLAVHGVPSSITMLLLR